MKFLLFILLSIFLVALPAFRIGGTVELRGIVKNECGYPVDNIIISIWKDSTKIDEVKSNYKGVYAYTLPEDGEYDIKVGINNRYYYLLQDSNIDILPIQIFRRDFVLQINRQELQHKTTRLNEACRHLVLNPKNVPYRGIFFSRFPSTLDEFLLFFSPLVPYDNLKKEGKSVIGKYYGFKLVSDTAYFSKYIEVNKAYIPEVDMKLFKDFSKGIIDLIAKNKEGFVGTLSYYNNQEVKSTFTNLLKEMPKDSTKGFINKLQYMDARIYTIADETSSEQKKK